MHAVLPQSAVIDAALSAAADLLGMELVFIGGLDEAEFRFERLRGSYPGVAEGLAADRTDSMCARMLAGGPPSTADAERDPHYADAAIRARFAIRSYVGVPIRTASDRLVGTLCGIDRGEVTVSDVTVTVLRDLAAIIATEADAADADVVIRRTPSGWSVAAHEPVDELVNAMTLADLLDGRPPPAGRPRATRVAGDETAALRTAVRQLEHALTARVTVEQAIGVLAERRNIAPRAAFELLRKVARGRGQKVHDLADLVVSSASGAAAALPTELR